MLLFCHRFVSPSSGRCECLCLITSVYAGTESNIAKKKRGKKKAVPCVYVSARNDIPIDLLTPHTNSSSIGYYVMYLYVKAASLSFLLHFLRSLLTAVTVALYFTSLNFQENKPATILTVFLLIPKWYSLHFLRSPNSSSIFLFFMLFLQWSKRLRQVVRNNRHHLINYTFNQTRSITNDSIDFQQSFSGLLSYFCTTCVRKREKWQRQKKRF